VDYYVVEQGADSVDDDWPQNFALIAEQCRRHGISWKDYLAYQHRCMEAAEQEKLTDYQRAEAQRDSRDPKAETGGLLLLYPVAAFAIWVGLSEPRLEICDTAQWLLTTIGGVWIAWVSIRLLIRERHWYRVLAFVGVTFALTGNDIRDGWLLTMGDPAQCDAGDRALLGEWLQLYGEVVGDPGMMRETAHDLHNFVRRGCISIADLEKQKYDLERKSLAQ
jgi:hypothetical protein